MPTHITAGRIAAGALATALTLGFGVSTAHADEDGLADRNTDLDQAGEWVVVEDEGGTQSTPFSKLFGLEYGDAELLTYCVEYHTPLHDDQKMQETPWAEYPYNNSFTLNADRIKWILHNSYPEMSLADIDNQVGGFTDLAVEDAIAATQAAIWHFSDNMDLVDEDDVTLVPGQGNQVEHVDFDPDIRTLYDYLVGGDNTGISEPELDLTVAPDALSGEAGSMIGPFTVSTNAANATVSATVPEGVTLVNADGNAITEAVNGTELFLDVPEDAAAGSATIDVAASAPISLGRLWVGERYAVEPSQSLILAASDSTELTAQATADWTAAPQETTTPTPTETPTPTPTETDEQLPDTGASLTLPIVAGVLLLVTGAAFVIRRQLTS